jgi:hypothetical protein
MFLMNKPLNISVYHLGWVLDLCNTCWFQVFEKEKKRKETRIKEPPVLGGFFWVQNFAKIRKLKIKWEYFVSIFQLFSQKNCQIHHVWTLIFV